jgi:hypothetical protein
MHEQYLKNEYAGIKDAVYTIACLTTACTLSVQVQRGRSKAYIQKLFDDIRMMYETPTALGKPIVLTEVMKQLEDEYDIDFKKIHVNFGETEKEYVKGCKKIR